MQNILIIGATSAIAEATARRFAQEGARFYLLARNRVRVELIAKDLEIRGASTVEYEIFDVNEVSLHHNLLEHAAKVLGHIDIALVAHGTLGNQTQCERNRETALAEFQTNASSTISLLTVLANIFEKQKKGTLAVISSVAGDRGRSSNYVYGASKAAVTVFCEGLMVRLHKAGAHLLLIKPGMVETPMTEKINAPAVLMVKPEEIAKDIIKAIEKKINILYTPWFWRFIMIGVIHLPVFIYKKIYI